MYYLPRTHYTSMVLHDSNTMEHIFSYLYADEIMTMTTTTHSMSNMSARREIIECLHAIVERQTDEAIEREEQMHLGQLIDAIHPPLPDFPDSD